jgi:hypothetical protein
LPSVGVQGVSSSCYAMPMLIFRKWGWIGILPAIVAIPFWFILPTRWADLGAGIVCAVAGVGLWFLGRRLNGKRPLRSIVDILEAGLITGEPRHDSSMFFIRVEYIGLLMVLFGFGAAALRPFARGWL